MIKINHCRQSFTDRWWRKNFSRQIQVRETRSIEASSSLSLSMPDEFIRRKTNQVTFPLILLFGKCFFSLSRCRWLMKPFEMSCSIKCCCWSNRCPCVSAWLFNAFKYEGRSWPVDEDESFSCGSMSVGCGCRRPSSSNPMMDLMGDTSDFGCSSFFLWRRSCVVLWSVDFSCWSRLAVRINWMTFFTA